LLYIITLQIRNLSSQQIMIQAILMIYK